jgi:hypothetical protein
MDLSAACPITMNVILSWLQVATFAVIAATLYVY